MIFLTFLYSMLRVNGSQIIDKTIYLIEGEEYKVNLDSIFKEDQENNYSFNSSNKGFTLDNSSLKLKSQGAYLQLLTKVLRERQLVHIEDNQGQGQFGILDQHDEGNRICYNNNTSIINLDQCIELDNTATSYDFVFIAKDTIAVSKIMVNDQQFGVTIYQNKEIISELYFIPSKTYSQITKTIIEYCVFGQNKYLLFGVTEDDSNIEFLEIKDDFILVNTNKVIDKSLIQQKQTLQVYDVRSILNMVYIVYNNQNQEKIIISFEFETNWIYKGLFLSQDFRGFELGYNFIQRSVMQTQLLCQQYSCSINSNNQNLIVKNFTYQIKSSAQVRYTLNYLIILQNNKIIVTNLQNTAQRTNQIEGILLRIDVDFQNDILIVFTDTKIMEYYLKQPTLSYSSNIITIRIDLVTIQAKSDTYEQIANINFQVLSKVDYNIYQLQDLVRDLYYNQYFYQTKFNIPLYGMSGADIQVDGIVDQQIQIIPQNQFKYGLQNVDRRFKLIIIQELLITNSFDPYLFRQYDDFTYSICQLIFKSDYHCFSFGFTNQIQKQRVTVQYLQVADQYVQLALLNSDGLQITTVNIFGLNRYKYIKTSQDNQFVDMKVGTDRLFVYTINYFIQFYYFPSGEFINKINLTQFGQPSGEEIKKLWVNQVKTNLLIFSYGEDLIIGRFTTQFIFMQRIKIKWVIDANIISDNKFIVLSTDKTNKKLTQYILEEGLIRIQRELDTHGYIITGDTILSDYFCGEIMIEAQKYQQKVIIVFGDSELERDSLLKVIQLQDDEFPENVIYTQQKSRLLIRTTDSEKNSSIIELNHTYQVFETNLTKIPNQFSQKLVIKYNFGSSFSKNKIEISKHFYLEYQFYNITVKQNDTITYENETQLNIPIKRDTFQGQVNKISLITNDTGFKLITRFKNNKQLPIPQVFQCKQIFKFQRIICIIGQSVIYLNINGDIIIKIKTTIQKYNKSLIQIILHNDDQYALIHSEDEQLFLIYISENTISQSSTIFNGWQGSLDNLIFHKKWLVVSDETKISYYKFLIYENDLWSLEKQHENLILGIQVIQYDPKTEQIFYSKGDQNLYYFKSSLDGDTLNIQLEYSLNLLIFLKKQFQNIYQVDLTIQNIKIVTNKQSYLLVTTSYGNIWNITIKQFKQDFSVKNMYIVNGPYPIVYDIQLLDDYMLVQNDYFQSLYKNTNNWQFNKPQLSLEGILGSKFMGLFKNGSQIVHFYIDISGYNLWQTNIDDDMYLTVTNLTSYTPGGILQIQASNNLGQALVNYQLVEEKIIKLDKLDIQLLYILVIIFVVLTIATIVHCKKKNKKQVEVEVEVEFIEQQFV